MALLTKNHLTLFSGDGSGFSRLCRGGGERGLGKGTGRTRVTAAPSCGQKSK